MLKKTMHDVGTIVILGAGLAGSFAARLLKDAGFHVIVLDKEGHLEVVVQPDKPIWAHLIMEIDD